MVEWNSEEQRYIVLVSPFASMGLRNLLNSLTVDDFATMQKICLTIGRFIKHYASSFALFYLWLTVVMSFPDLQLIFTLHSCVGVCFLRDMEDKNLQHL